MTTGFVAFPGDPSEIGQSIEAAARAHNQRFGPDTLCTWRENDIAGRFLIGPIFDHIRDTRCLVADVSVLNFNVTYEVGYAIGLGRRVFLIKNRSLSVEDGGAVHQTR